MKVAVHVGDYRKEEYHGGGNPKRAVKIRTLAIGTRHAHDVIAESIGHIAHPDGRNHPLYNISGINIEVNPVRVQTEAGLDGTEDAAGRSARNAGRRAHSHLSAGRLLVSAATSSAYRFRSRTRSRGQAAAATAVHGTRTDELTLGHHAGRGRLEADGIFPEGILSGALELRGRRYSRRERFLLRPWLRCAAAATSGSGRRATRVRRTEWVRWEVSLLAAGVHHLAGWESLSRVE
mmetsp:Transcript_23483/g.50910  ORF Transcript_23483/g.50910 Transcript_23483/m.50910 type:complete len:235 (+) Transcript_23483:605-1309(+)